MSIIRVARPYPDLNAHLPIPTWDPGAPAKALAEPPRWEDAQETVQAAEQRNPVLVDRRQRDVCPRILVCLPGCERELVTLQQDVCGCRVDADAGGVWREVDEDLVGVQFWDS